MKQRSSQDFLELVKHSKNYISADIFSKGLMVLTIPIFTRLLVPSEYGILAVFTSIITIFTVVFNFGTKGSIARYYYENKGDFDCFLGSNISLIFLASLCLFPLIFIFRSNLALFFSVSEEIVLYGAVISFLSAFYMAYNSYLQAAKLSGLMSKLSIIRSILITSVAVLLMLILPTNKYRGMIYAQLLASLILFFIAIKRISPVMTISLGGKYLKYSLTFGLPLVLHNLSGYILNTFDQVVINQLLGARDTGIYSLAYKVGSLHYMITWAILRAYTPIFYQKMNSKSYVEIENLAHTYVSFVFLLALFLCFFAREIVMLLASDSYGDALWLIPIIILGYVFNFFYVLYVQYAFYFKKTQNTVFITTVTGFVNIGLNYWLIPIFGYVAAAYTTVVSFVLFWLLHYLNIRYIVKFQHTIKIRSLLFPLLISIFFYLLYLISHNYMNNIYLQILFRIILLSTVFLLMRRIKNV